jgi:hypothetical protein
MSFTTKSLIVSVAVALVMAVTLTLRSKQSPAQHPQLTPAQLAEVKPPPPSKPEASKQSAPVNDPSDLPPPPEDEIEDGNGS